MKTIKFFMTLIFVSSMVFAAGAARVSLMITPPNDDGGSPLVCYIVEKQEVGTDRWEIAGKPAAAMVEHNGSFVYVYTPCVVGGLIEGKTYVFRVFAENAYGKGDPGVPSTEVEVKQDNDDIGYIRVVSGLGRQRVRSMSFSALSDAPFTNQALEREMVYRKEELLANLFNKCV